MKDWSRLLQPPAGRQPLRTRDAAGPLWDALRAVPGLQARLLRGARMETLDGALAEFAAALQFPPYASATLDGLEECLNDLDWLPPGPLALLVLDGPRLLAQEPEAARAALRRILADAARAWAAGENGAARPFHLLLQD